MSHHCACRPFLWCWGIQTKVACLLGMHVTTRDLPTPLMLTHFINNFQNHNMTEPFVHCRQAGRPSQGCSEESELPAQGLIAGSEVVLCTVWVPGTFTWRTFPGAFQQGNLCFQS